ncbi:MAG: hypothetical protein JW745_00820 [Sedimentisphaerales bacterium]|nr:hypothetical protein [Sedimentisphaerales bacterium]MBN2842630.1 hypothetical protein [Sedimentisphaerales bacterium]
MGDYGSGSETSVFLAVGLILILVILVKIFYLMALSRALSCCSARNRKISPGMVWLEIIPVIGFIWAFVNVIQVSGSLGAEFRTRGIEQPDNPSMVLGIVACALNVGSSVMPFAGIAGLICWIIYWVKINAYANMLTEC